MPQVHWQASPNGRYWIDVRVGNQPLAVLVDTGLIDPLDKIGFELDPGVFDPLTASGLLTATYYRQRRDASGQLKRALSGQTTAQFLDPATRQAIGPHTIIEVFRGDPQLPSRVGVVFFHRLAGCRVIWELDQRSWGIEYP